MQTVTPRLDREAFFIWGETMNPETLPLAFMTREVFDALIIGVIVLGLALAAVRLYADLSRPLPPDEDRQK